ncbi:hypothetical protein GALMADRAFT_226910 [Galerina marginata CBS 339.88]|uniref:Uncharacterized protein n=1 Tax=Galerina marginata (strain CBS 339.88) TaxID=685588 RepID=A0A067SWG1_GALM3|nr:hypothetical protein GALMADRAFT_226910 [Galerina marginata CBS 339.88]
MLWDGEQQLLIGMCPSTKAVGMRMLLWVPPLTEVKSQEGTSRAGFTDLYREADRLVGSPRYDNTIDDVPYRCQMGTRVFISDRNESLMFGPRLAAVQVS